MIPLYLLVDDPDSYFPVNTNTIRILYVLLELNFGVLVRAMEHRAVSPARVTSPVGNTSTSWEKHINHPEPENFRGTLGTTV